jgi:hypothetical protein
VSIRVVVKKQFEPELLSVISCDVLADARSIITGMVSAYFG